MSIDQRHPSTSEQSERADLELEAWGVGRTVKDLQEEVQIASPKMPNRELILNKLDEIMALIPAWTATDENNDQAKRAAFQRTLSRRRE